MRPVECLDLRGTASGTIDRTTLVINKDMDALVDGWPSHDRTVVWPFSGSEPVRACRWIVSAVCSALGLDGSTVEDAKIICSELATNAVLHGDAPYELRLLISPGRLVVQVVDGLIRPLTLPASGPAPEDVQLSGRGLWIVHLLSEGRCGVEVTTTLTGSRPRQVKSVWAAIPLGISG